MNNSENNIQITVANNLKRIRESKGITQEMLNFKTNISVNQISRIELAKINTTIGTLAILAEALGVDVNDFFINHEH